MTQSHQKPAPPQVQLPWAPNPSTRTRPQPQKKFQALLQPLPSIPEDDVSDLDEEQRIRLAIALDVLCSATRRIETSPKILAEAVMVWLRLRGTDDEVRDHEELTKLASSMVGRARARLNDGLLKTLVRSPSVKNAPVAQPPTAVATASTYATLSNPESVAQALTHVEKAGHLLVQETILWFASRNQTIFKQG